MPKGGLKHPDSVIKNRDWYVPQDKEKKPVNPRDLHKVKKLRLW